MTNKFAVDSNKSESVSRKLQRLIRLLQLQSPDAVIEQEIAAIQRELSDASEVVTVSATVETKQ